MFCPRCGSNQSEEVKFCKLCGANLVAIRQAIDARETDKKFEWGNTWLAEMFMSGAAATKLQAEIDRAKGLTPEVRRYNEIKAGVITGSVGIALSLFLFIFMQALVLGGRIPDHVAPILNSLWAVGLIPLFVGIALIINGAVVSKKIVEALAREKEKEQVLLPAADPRSLRSGETTQFVSPNYSVTEETTKHLRNAE
jgi:hypothetical protein